MIATGLELTSRFVRITAAEATKYLSHEGQGCPSIGDGSHSEECDQEEKV